jgi:hypothetical protein
MPNLSKSIFVAHRQFSARIESDMDLREASRVCRDSRRACSHLTVLLVVEYQESAEDTCRQSICLLKLKTRPDAIYISTAKIAFQ